MNPFNRPLLKITLIPLLFCVFDLIILLCFIIKYSTKSSLYLEIFPYGITPTLLIFGIPDFILLFSALLLIIFAKFYKGLVTKRLKIILIIPILIIFIASHILYTAVFINTKNTVSHHELYISELLKDEEYKCEEYKLKVNQRKTGDSMPTPPQLTQINCLP